MTTYDESLSFTDHGWNSLYEVVDDPYFSRKDSEMIYQSLRNSLRIIPFCDHLKRFLYREAGMLGPYQNIPLRDYQEILMTSFRERSAPASFEQTSTTKLSAACLNWLTQKNAARSTVLLLGFGLGLNRSEVNDFLEKGLQEEDLNDEDPQELICGYCYDHGYTWPKYEQLRENWQEGNFSIANKEERLLFRKLQNLKEGQDTQWAQAQYQAFTELYQKALTLLAANYNRTVWTNHPRRAADLSAADLESMLYSAVPKDVHGNLTPAKKSALFERFNNRRLTRQRIASLLRRDLPVSRSDLITLNFFIWTQADEELSPRKRYLAFVQDTNRILHEGGYGDLYVTLPYECFLMMCLLTEDPMLSYLDIWERSYREETPPQA